MVSPDQRVTAVLVWEGGRGATGATAQHLYLVAAQGKEKLNHPNMATASCAGLSMAWKSSALLQVSYIPECRIKQFANFWYGHWKGSRTTPVEIVLVRTEHAAL